MNLGRPASSNQEFNYLEQNEEENFNNLGINQNGENINDQNDNINLPGIGQINNPITNDNQKNNQNKQDKENNTKSISKFLTKSKSFPTRREITEMVCKTTSLLDLMNDNKTFKQIVDEKEEELKNEYNNQIVRVNENEMGEEKNKIIKEDDISKNEIKENINDENKNSSSEEEKENEICPLDEEDEEIKEKRALAIEKILKNTDEVVDIPNFKILDESKIKDFLNKDDDFVEKINK